MSRLCIGIAVWLLGVGQVLAQPAQVIIIRHAEKPDEGNGLSLKGKERAAALVPYFIETHALLNYGTPTGIYAQAQKHATSSVRPIETVTPLAKKLGLTINESFERDDFKDMVGQIMHANEYKDHTVLICWEHNVIPNIAVEFGVADAPTEWDGGVFDRTWIITFRPGHNPRFENSPQQLMFHDSKE